ncbi:MAG: hypothetical protein OJF48_003421 [Afipia sp.]|jgi:hypothetical protein|nr:MAG: hypothetical protein OJF48_003421 [Afipia sp.]
MTAAPASPVPPVEGATLETRVSFGDMIALAENEAARVAIWRDDFFRAAGEASDPVKRESLLAIARDRAHVVATFETIAKTIERVRGDGLLKTRLREVAQQQAAEEAASAGLAVGDEASRETENNAS